MNNYSLVVFDKKEKKILCLSLEGKIIESVSLNPSLADVVLSNKVPCKNFDNRGSCRDSFFVLFKENAEVVKYDKLLHSVYKYKIPLIEYVDDITIDPDENFYAISTRDNIFIKCGPNYTGYSSISYTAPVFVALSLSGQMGLYNNNNSKFAIHSSDEKPVFKFCLDSLDKGAKGLFDMAKADAMTSYVLYPQDKLVKKYLHQNRSLVFDREFCFDGEPIGIVEIANNIYVGCRNPSKIYVKNFGSQDFIPLATFANQDFGSLAALQCTEK